MSSPRDIGYWEERYKNEAVEVMPWFYEPLDPDLLRSIEHFHLTPTRLLDIGAGPGTQAIEFARRGFDVTATDISAEAISKLKLRAEQSGVSMEIVRDDILKSSVTGTFGVILDRGCFHVLPPEKREIYRETVYRLLDTKGYLFLKCFSELEPREDGPYRFSPEELRRTFDSQFLVESIVRSEYQGTNPVLPKALFAVLRPKPQG